MWSPLVWMILAMGAVTYIPRMLPFVLFDTKEMPPFLEGVLKNIPYAVLGALIFPGVLYIKEGSVLYGAAGAAAAFALAALGLNVIMVIVGSIAVLSLYSIMF